MDDLKSPLWLQLVNDTHNTFLTLQFQKSLFLVPPAKFLKKYGILPQAEIFYLQLDTDIGA